MSLLANPAGPEVDRSVLHKGHRDDTGALQRAVQLPFSKGGHLQRWVRLPRRAAPPSKGGRLPFSKIGPQQRAVRRPHSAGRPVLVPP